MRTLIVFFLIAFAANICSAQGYLQNPHSSVSPLRPLAFTDAQRIRTPEPRLHHSFDDRWNEFIGQERASILTTHAQVWVVDTAFVYSTTDTTRHRYSFNGLGKMTVDWEEKWMNNLWVNYGRWTYAYDSEGRMLTCLTEIWVNFTQCKNYSRITYAYDANGRPLTELYEVWTNNQWEAFFRYTYTCDANGRMLTELEERWTSSGWVNVQRYTYTYDANGNRLTSLHEAWTNNQWVNDYRYSYTYDMNGRLLTELYEDWMNNQWVNYLRYTYTYDANGNRLTSLYEWWTNSQWVNSERRTYTYDINGKMITQLVEQWSINQWLNSSRYTYTYDANGSRLTELHEAWTNNQWVNVWRYNYAYNTNGNMATGQYEEWQGGIWVPRNSFFSMADSAGNSYGWSGHKVMVQYRLITTDVAQSGTEMPTQFALAQNYPNPFNPSTTIEYSVPHQASVEIKVVDVLGREVATLVNEEKPAGAHTVRWNADDVASGVYFYRLKAGGFVQMRKMLLVR